MSGYRSVYSSNENQRHVFGRPNSNWRGPRRASEDSQGAGSLHDVRSSLVVPDVSVTAYLDDVLDSDLLERHVEDKLVRLREHPENPDIVVANYAQSVSYGSLWDDVTSQCRGLIFNRDTGEVLARPWAKFFNHNQVEAPDMAGFGDIEVTDKMDGSLIIGWRDGHGGMRTSTKGSFNSEMVPVADSLLVDHGGIDIDPEWTPLFEVIYPGNRVVVDYHGKRDLFALGAVNMVTGEVVGPEHEILDGWKGPRTEVFEVDGINDVLQMKPRENAEGVIIRDVDTGEMVKIKQDDYVDLHRMVTNMSTLHVWELLKNDDIAKLIDDAPDELYDSLQSHVNDFTSQHDAEVDAVMRVRDEILGDLGLSVDREMSREERKAFAIEVQGRGKRLSSKLFAATFNPDGLSEMVWNDLRPDPQEREYLGFAQMRNHRSGGVAE